MRPVTIPAILDARSWLDDSAVDTGSNDAGSLRMLQRWDDVDLRAGVRVARARGSVLTRERARDYIDPLSGNRPRVEPGARANAAGAPRV